ncbi:MAG: radical SAM family heme chaperone HemW, partial [Methanomassiliicoccales archaeon]
ERLAHPEITTVYLGGGTPSLLPPMLVGQILEALASAFVMQSNTEISMEANPGTVSHTVWKQYINQGINRISLGVQSLADQNLKLLGRVHSVEDVYGAVSSLRRMGFNNYNIDLIYGIPGQTEEGLKRELVLLGNFLGSHLSAYSLQVEEDTPLYDLVARGNLVMPDEDVTANMYEMIQEFAAKIGMRQYELSNWALPGHESRHNLAYWHMRPYLGLGAGAVSRLDERRTKNISNIEAYIAGAAVGEIPSETLEILDEASMVQETLIIGLRLMEGVSLANFTQRFGRLVTDYYPQVIPAAIAEGSLIIADDHLKLTPPTYLLANQVLCRF